jgi:hypothetical protein
MKKYIPHTFVAITTFIGAASIEPGQCIFFLALSIAGMLYIYRNEIEQHLRR